MRRSLLLPVLILLAIAAVFSPTAAETPNPVQSHGRLQVVGSKLCDEGGNPVQLRGMSSHGLQWFPMTEAIVDNLARGWRISVIRAAMYTAESGYIGHEQMMTNSVRRIVDAAIADGIYAIIDWHILSDGDPNKYREQAKAFFMEMARAYGNYPNVIYEICNEPNGNVSWQGQIRPYAEYIIKAIRAIDPDNIIIVGTANWSQRVRDAADSPLAGSNIMYALHFYAGTHRVWLRNDADYVLGKGIALFVTEWGTTGSSGDGPLDLAEAQLWVDWMRQNGVSWCNWSFCRKAEASAALKPDAPYEGPWPDAQLSESGKWVKSKIAE